MLKFSSVISSFHPGQKITSVPVWFSLTHLYFVSSWPVKNDTLPLPPCSYCRTEDGPFCILTARICHICDSHKGILCRSFPRALSLEQPVIRTPQDAPHFPEQTRKQLYGVQLSGLTVQRQMAVNWLTSLRKDRESEVQAQNSRKAKGQKGSRFCLCHRKWHKLISGSRKPPFHTNMDFSEHRNGWH